MGGSDVIVLLILILIVLLILGVLWITPVTFCLAYSNKMYKVRDTDHYLPKLIYRNKRPFLLKRRTLNQMALLLKKVTQLFEKHDVMYFINAGTLLGAVRHQGFIPWDDDIDLIIPLSEQDKVLSLQDVFIQEGMKLTCARGGFKLGFKNWITAYPYVDLVIAKERNGALQPCFPVDVNGCYTYEVAYDCPNEYYTCEDSFPLQTIDFEGFKVKAPNNLVKQVEQQYGKEALTMVTLGSKGYFPWILNHYFDNLLYHLGIIKG